MSHRHVDGTPREGEETLEDRDSNGGGSQKTKVRGLTVSGRKSVVDSE